MCTLIQWNCRGFRANFTELGILAADHNPVVFCLQETFLKPTDFSELRRYRTYNTYGTITNDRAAGGSSILVKADAIHTPIPLTTTLQACAVRLTLHKTITICSLYVSPSCAISRHDLDDLAIQLPAPYVIMGDFNSHNPMWGSSNLNDKGRVVEDFVAANGLCIFNDGTNTYLHPGYGTYTAIDLTICDPSLFVDFTWDVLEDSHGSDHFPIVLCNVVPSVLSTTPKWKFRRAD